MTQEKHKYYENVRFDLTHANISTCRYIFNVTCLFFNILFCYLSCTYNYCDSVLILHIITQLSEDLLEIRSWSCKREMFTPTRPWSFSDRSKIMKWGPNEPSTFKNGDP